MKNKILSSILCLSLISSLVTPIFATDYSTTADLVVEGLVFNLTVPTSLPIDVNSSGGVSVATNYKITNNSGGAVVVESVSVTEENGWDLVGYDTDFSKEKVNLKEVGLVLNGDEVQTDGSVTLTDSWVSIPANGGTLPLTYNANVASQSTSLSDVEIATVQFTLGWDAVKTPIITGVSQGQIINLNYGDIYTAPTVTATDYEGNDLDVVISGDTVDTNTADTYEVIYTAIDETNGTEKAVTTYVVVGKYVALTYFTLDSDTAFTLATYNSKKNWDGTLYYSTDTTNWDVWSGTDSISSNDSGELYLAGTDNTKITGTVSSICSWSFTDATNLECIGNIENLLDWETVTEGNHPEMGTSCYYMMFNDCTSLKTAPALPATDLSYACYFRMFDGCTNLETAPDLPAETLASYCYTSMFSGCTNLTTAPTLPAETLATGCYQSMFKNCTSLETAPALPAETLAIYCYYSMFSSCTSLETAPALPAETLADSCYYSMFCCCTSLTTAPALPAETLTTSCYKSMFYGCTSLETAPDLPAETLANYCYQNMFKNCSSLKISNQVVDGEYIYEWRIPTTGNIDTAPSGWNTNMLSDTGGTFTSNPSINTTYYLVNEPVSN